MPVYVIRWPNGDIGLTCARNADEARLNFDEFAEPMNLPMKRLKAGDLNLTLRLRSDYSFVVDGWGDHMHDVLDWAHPIVAKAMRDEPPPSLGPGVTAEQRKAAVEDAKRRMRDAVKAERRRVRQTRKPCQMPHVVEYLQRHPPEQAPTPRDVADFAESMGTDAKELAANAFENFANEVAHLPVETPKRRKRGRGRNLN